MITSAWTFAFAIAGTVIAVGILMMPLTLLVVSVILRQRRSPASSVTWLLSILLLPLIAIPLFWLFGSRKIQGIVRAKPPVELTVIEPAAGDATHPDFCASRCRSQARAHYPAERPDLSSRRRGGIRRCHLANRQCKTQHRYPNLYA